MRIVVAISANTEDPFNAPVTDVKKHRLIRVERAFRRSVPALARQSYLSRSNIVLELKAQTKSESHSYKRIYTDINVKLEVRKLLENGDDSHQSSPRFVSLPFDLQPTSYNHNQKIHLPCLLALVPF
jgi:hypothetical protein